MIAALKEKNLLSRESKFFSLKVAIIEEGVGEATTILFIQGIHESKVFKIFTGLGYNNPIHSGLKKVKLLESRAQLFKTINVVN